MAQVSTQKSTIDGSQDNLKSSRVVTDVLQSFMEIKDNLMSRTISADWDALSKNILDRSIG
jgi:hypothetical protein